MINGTDLCKHGDLYLNCRDSSCIREFRGSNPVAQQEEEDRLSRPGRIKDMRAVYAGHPFPLDVKQCTYCPTWALSETPEKAVEILNNHQLKLVGSYYGLEVRIRVG